jgi:hypothetical protein
MTQQPCPGYDVKKNVLDGDFCCHGDKLVASIPSGLIMASRKISKSADSGVVDAANSEGCLDDTHKSRKESIKSYESADSGVIDAVNSEGCLLSPPMFIVNRLG